MNSKLKTQLLAELATAQKGARVRLETPESVIATATAIERFLRRAPESTAVRSCWSRVANSYRGVPEATFVRGEKTASGIEIHVMRGAGGFGARNYAISRPNGYKVTGHDAHPSSGATDDLASAKLVPIE